MISSARNTILLIFLALLVFVAYKSCQGVKAAKSYFKEQEVQSEQKAKVDQALRESFLKAEIAKLKNTKNYDQAINEFKIQDPTFLILVALIENTRKGTSFSTTILSIELSELLDKTGRDNAFSPLVTFNSIIFCSAKDYPDCVRFILYLRKNKLENEDKSVAMAVTRKINDREIHFLKLYREYFPAEFDKNVN